MRDADSAPEDLADALANSGKDAPDHFGGVRSAVDVAFVFGYRVAVLEVLVVGRAGVAGKHVADAAQTDRLDCRRHPELIGLSDARRSRHEVGPDGQRISRAVSV